MCKVWGSDSGVAGDHILLYHVAGTAVASSGQTFFMDWLTLKVKALNLEPSVPIYQSTESNIPEALKYPISYFNETRQDNYVCGVAQFSRHKFIQPCRHFPFPNTKSDSVLGYGMLHRYELLVPSVLYEIPNTNMKLSQESLTAVL